ncbi:toprim domain-containing protein [Echinicola marina]|nr:toprim domain-containing protein [Echinicola marina]
MNCKQANKIRISEYLSALGIHPKRNLGQCSYYLSPIREEKTPSFKVDHRVNLWIDYGDNNSGGTLIDLILKLNPSFSVEDALNQLKDLKLESFSFQQQTILEDIKIEPKIKVTNTKPIGTNKAISDYLVSRQISPLIAQHFCKEVYFVMNGKRYFGVGNENSNGWSIRNKYWKGCSGQGVSIYGDVENEYFATLSVFEGIFDLMSFVQMNKFSCKATCFLILNSLSNVKEALPYFKSFQTVELYLDRDEAGKKVTKELLETNVNCFDKSRLYDLHKDLNEKVVQERKFGLGR